MKKIKIASVIIAAVMLCMTIAMPAVFAAGEGAKVYTVLGDSIAAGYRLEDYQKDGVTPPSSYAALFAGKIGATKVNNLAKTGSNTADTLTLLSTQTYISAVKEADVITLSMGSNDILGPGGKMICACLGITSLDNAGNAVNATNFLQKMTELSNYINEPEQVKIFNDAISGFEANWTKIIDRIYELNPDAELIVNNFYNPYAALDLGSSIVIGSTVQGYLNRMNQYIASHRYNGNRYVVADVTAVMAHTNVGLLPNFDLDPHPNKDGHSMIADAVYAEYVKLSSPSSTETSGSTAVVETSIENPGPGTTVTEPSGTPSVEPTGTPSTEPTGTPSTEPTGTPSVEPTGTPSVEPTGTISTEPSGDHSDVPEVTSSGDVSETELDTDTPEAAESGSVEPSDSGSQSETGPVDVSDINIISLLTCNSGNGVAAAAIFICTVGAAVTVVLKRR